MTSRARQSSLPAPVTAKVRIFIPREPAVVFDYFSDLRNEPQYNRQVSGIRKTSAGPIGQGTTFEGSHVGLGPVSWQLSQYDRPRHVVIEGGVGESAYRWTSDFEPGEGGTWMIGAMEWRPPPRWRTFGRLLGMILYLNARRSFRRMAQVLRREGSPTKISPAPFGDWDALVMFRPVGRVGRVSAISLSWDAARFSTRPAPVRNFDPATISLGPLRPAGATLSGGGP